MSLKKKVSNEVDTYEDELIKNKLRYEQIKGENLPGEIKVKNKIYSIRLPENYKNILENYFRKDGLSFSTGVRMVLYKYMKNEKLIDL